MKTPVSPLSDAEQREILRKPLSRLNLIYVPNDAIDEILDYYYKGNLLEYLKREQVDDEILFNLLNVYEQIAKCLFWDSVFCKDDAALANLSEYYDQALQGFSYLVEHLSTRELTYPALYDLGCVSEHFYDGDDAFTDLPPLSIDKPYIKSSAEKIHEIAQRSTYKNKVMSCVLMPGHLYRQKMIRFAVWFYGIDEFETYFQAAKEEPGLYLEFTYWFNYASTENRIRFLRWAHNYLRPEELLNLREAKALITLEAHEANVLTAVLTMWDTDFSEFSSLLDLALLITNDVSLNDILNILDASSVQLWPKGTLQWFKDLERKYDENTPLVKCTKNGTAFIILKDQLAYLRRRFEAR